MLRILTVVGARPQFVKAAALHRAVIGHFSHRIEEILVHTGQHYDANLSDVFFRELGIPEPVVNLETGSGSHSRQTARIIEGLEPVLLKYRPDVVVVYGDTNSTLAAALTAASLRIPLAHVEAGLRSYDKDMPEEVNRLLTDHLSTFLFAPTSTAINNLRQEGIAERPGIPPSADSPLVSCFGDVMYDNSLHYREMDLSWLASPPVSHHSRYLIATVHRENNTDDPERLFAIVEALLSLADQIDVLFPIHPRTRKALLSLNQDTLLEKFNSHPAIHLLEPVTYLTMQKYLRDCSLVVTDSGGLQKEAYFHHKPVIILRRETEWPEIVEAGSAMTTDTNPQAILAAFRNFSDKPPASFPELFGNGNAAVSICNSLLNSI